MDDLRKKLIKALENFKDKLNDEDTFKGVTKTSKFIFKSDDYHKLKYNEKAEKPNACIP